MADMMYGPAAGGDVSEDSAADFGGLNNAGTRQKFPGLYVGNLTWWTTDQDVIKAINSVGVNDVQEVKFFENRNNGQSKGFCVVTFNTDASLPIIMDKLPKLELHGQNPVVTPYNRQNLNLFESQTQKRPQINSNNGPNTHASGIMGINSISGVHANTQGLPYSGLNAYNQAAGTGPNLAGGPRAPAFHSNMRMQMRGPRAGMRGAMPGAMGNGPMIPVGPMNRMRFMQPQGWNNNQHPYNPATRLSHVNMDMPNRMAMGAKPDDSGIDQEMISSNSGSQNYYASHHMSSSSDHYRNDRAQRDERLSRRDEDRTSTRRDEAPSSRRDEVAPQRREEGSSRRERDDRSARREDKSARHRERGHRSSERTRSRSREKSRDRSRERKERRDRSRGDRDRDRGGDRARERDRERDRDRDRDRRERY